MFKSRKVFLSCVILMGSFTHAFADQNWVMTKVSGDNQTQHFAYESHVGMPAATFAPLQVKLVDASGKPVSGATVSWVCTNLGMACEMTEASNYPHTTSTTNANGIATLDQQYGNAFYVIYDGGTEQVQASVQGKSVVFNENAVKAPPVPSHLVIVSGANQTKQLDPNYPAYPGGATKFDPILLRMIDSNGNGVAGESVCPLVLNAPQGENVDVNQGGCMITNQNGDVTFPGPLVWGGTSAFIVSFPPDGMQSSWLKGISTTMSITLPPPPTGNDSMTIVSGDKQTQHMAPQPHLGMPAASFSPIQVKVVDDAGNPVAGATVHWMCIEQGGMACAMTEASNFPQTTSTTDSNGIATLDQQYGSSFYSFYETGTQQVRASCENASVVFTEFAVP